MSARPCHDQLGSQEPVAPNTSTFQPPINCEGSVKKKGKKLVIACFVGIAVTIFSIIFGRFSVGGVRLLGYLYTPGFLVSKLVYPNRFDSLELVSIAFLANAVFYSILAWLLISIFERNK